MTNVAIDFGTSNTVISCLDAITQTPKILRFDQISRKFASTMGNIDVVPSLVFVQESNQLVFGEQAKLSRKAWLRKTNGNDEQIHRFFQAFKRDLVANYRFSEHQIDQHFYTAEYIAGKFIQQIWEQIILQEPKSNKVILTIPINSFKLYETWLQNLTHKLKLPPVQIIDEATAAAFSYGAKKFGSIVLVINFSGTSLNLNLVRTVAPKERENVCQAEVIATLYSCIGGVDIDIWLAEYYLQKIGLSRGDIKEIDWLNLLEMAEGIKIKLSMNNEAEEYFFGDDNILSKPLHLSREEFENIIIKRKLLNNIQQALNEVLLIALDKGISKDNIEQVVLVGGSSLIPSVQQLIVSYFGEHKVKFDNPFEAVAYGALALSQFVKYNDNFLQHSCAISLWEPYLKNYSYLTLFEKGTAYPYQLKQTLTLQAATNEQSSVYLCIGEIIEEIQTEVVYEAKAKTFKSQQNKKVKFSVFNNLLQSAYVIPLKPFGQAGLDRLEIAFEINEKGILIATITDLITKEVIINKIAINITSSFNKSFYKQDLELKYSAVLGGLQKYEGLINSSAMEQRIKAFLDVQKLIGKSHYITLESARLIIKTLKKESKQFQQVLHWILASCNNNIIKEVFNNYKAYWQLDCLEQHLEIAREDNPQFNKIIFPDNKEPTEYKISDLRKINNALNNLIKDINISDNLAWVIASRGETYRLLGYYEKAIQDFNLAIELDPCFIPAIVSRGKTYCLMKNYQKALANFDIAISLHPNYAWAIASRGEVYSRTGNYKQALIDFQRAITVDGDYAWAIANRGKIYCHLENYQEALADFDRASKIVLNYAWAIAYKGYIHHLKEDYQIALLIYDQAIELFPHWIWLIANRGQLHRQLCRYDKALDDFNRAINLNPNQTWLVANRGLTYRQIGRYEDSLVDFNRAIQLNPNINWFIASRGETYRLMERHQEALKDFNKAIENNLNFVWAIGNRARVYQAKGNYEEALADLNRVIELDSNLDWAFANRGNIYLKLEQYSKALADFNTAIEINPKYKWAISRRNTTLRLMGKSEEFSQEISDNWFVQLFENVVEDESVHDFIDEQISFISKFFPNK
ncbi:MAG: tetratricopeptide repeat protein [Cyanobacteria bacterium P01_D01_bin.50]